MRRRGSHCIIIHIINLPIATIKVYPNKATTDARLDESEEATVLIVVILARKLEVVELYNFLVSVFV